MTRVQQFFSSLFGHLVAWFKLRHVDKDENYYAKLGWHLLIWGFGGFVAWASLAPLDQGVSAPGFIITASNRQAIQPLTSGMVEEILVREGEVVKAGQVLVRLNPINAQAQDISLRESIDGLNAQVRGLEQSIAQKKMLVQSLEKQVSATRELVDEGYYARNRLLELERQYFQTSASLADDQGNLVRVRKQVNEQLAKAKATEFDLFNTELKSPVDGRVVNLTIFTKGGVVGAGSTLMEVIPTNESLIIEGQLPVHLVDKAHAGQSVELLFTAFNQNRTPHIPAQLKSVGADRILDERTGTPFFKVQAVVAPEGIRMLNSLKLTVRPGMPVEIFIRTGERTLMSYLLKPIIDRSYTALREE